MPEQVTYTVGGTVQAGGGPYLVRRADEELLALCREGAFAYVLTSRQLGKSSLMVRTAEHLATEGVRSVIIDLSLIGVQVTVEEWYLGLLTMIEQDLMLTSDVVGWWVEHQHLGPSQRLMEFFEKVLLQEIQERVIIFIDEIDSTLNLDFTDDFYAAIRAVYNARARTPAFRCLSFVLIGVATPGDLINDPKRTPFNIGRRVDLDDFTYEEALPLAAGLGLPEREARQMLRWIIDWTGGHPYLTQRLCSVVAGREHARWREEDVGRAVADTFLGEESEKDHNLLFVRDMLTKRAPDPVAVLAVYRKVRLERRPVPDEPTIVKSHLKLSGVVRLKGGVLRVRNRIYATVFDRRWIREHWPEHWIKRIPPKVIAAVVFSLMLIALVMVALFGWSQAQLASEQAQLAESREKAMAEETRLRQLAEGERQRAEGERQRAEEQAVLAAVRADEAERARAAAIAARREAEAQRMRAEDSAQAAKVQRELAEKNATEAEEQRRRAEQNEQKARSALIDNLAPALTSKALHQLRLGNVTIGAALARQAYLMEPKALEGESLNLVYDALRQSLNAVTADSTRGWGGPQVLRGHSDWVRAVAYSPDGRWIASAADDGVRLWNTQGDQDIVLQEHEDGARALAFSPDGRLLASGGMGGEVLLWHNLASSSPGATRIARLDGPVQSLAFSPDGRLLAIAGVGSRVEVWDREAERAVAMLQVQDQERPFRAVAFSPAHGAGRYAVAAAGEEGLYLWTLQLRANPAEPLEGHVIHRGQVHAFAFSPSGDTLAVGGHDISVRLLRRSSDGTWAPLPLNAYNVEGASWGLHAHEGAIFALAITQDGKKLASGSADHSIKVWDLMNLATTGPISLQEHQGWVWALAFGPEGTELASGSADRTVRVWKIDPVELADEICEVTDGQLSARQWREFIDEEELFSYEERFVPCLRGPVSSR